MIRLREEGMLRLRICSDLSIYETAIGPTRDFNRAAKWYSKVAKVVGGDSHVIANAQLHLGWLYEAGRVGNELKEQQRYLKAEELYMKAREISVDGYVYAWETVC